MGKLRLLAAFWLLDKSTTCSHKWRAGPPSSTPPAKEKYPGKDSLLAEGSSDQKDFLNLPVNSLQTRSNLQGLQDAK